MWSVNAAWLLKFILAVSFSCFSFIRFLAPQLILQSSSFYYVDTTERLNCLQEAVNSVLRAADRQGGLSPHHLNAATNLLKEAMKKKDEDSTKK